MYVYKTWKKEETSWEEGDLQKIMGVRSITIHWIQVWKLTVKMYAPLDIRETGFLSSLRSSVHGFSAKAP